MTPAKFMTPEQIKVIRTSLGMSQEAFAAAIDVSFATVNRWEKGKSKPQRNRIDRIRALLQEQEAASDILRIELLRLFNQDPATLSPDQRRIRDWVTGTQDTESGR